MTPVTELRREPVCQAEAFSGHRAASRRSGDDTVDDPRRGPPTLPCEAVGVPGTSLPHSHDSGRRFIRPSSGKGSVPRPRNAVFFPAALQPAPSDLREHAARCVATRWYEMICGSSCAGACGRGAAGPPTESPVKMGGFYAWTLGIRSGMAGLDEPPRVAEGPLAEPSPGNVPLAWRSRRGRLTHPASTWNTP